MAAVDAPPVIDLPPQPAPLGRRSSRPEEVLQELPQHQQQQPSLQQQGDANEALGKQDVGKKVQQHQQGDEDPASAFECNICLEVRQAPEPLCRLEFVLFASSKPMCPRFGY